MKLKQDIRAIARNFQIYGEFLEGEPYGSGHINDTYCVVFNQGGTRVRYIFQRVNHSIFKNPAALMENIQRVTTHLVGKVAGEPDPSRRVLTLIPARDGAAYYRDDTGNFWRAYIFIEAARGYDAVEKPSQALSAAKAFGRFQKLLADL
ncbi:MAG TPA: mucin desulfatase, partial [Verrucomicrobiae bacterium]|nr:mucin desulfatase [Verrucomicrobiae bacterium]